MLYRPLVLLTASVACLAPVAARADVIAVGTFSTDNARTFTHPAGQPTTSVRMGFTFAPNGVTLLPFDSWFLFSRQYGVADAGQTFTSDASTDPVVFPVAVASLTDGLVGKANPGLLASSNFLITWGSTEQNFFGLPANQVDLMGDTIDSIQLRVNTLNLIQESDTTTLLQFSFTVSVIGQVPTPAAIVPLLGLLISRRRARHS